MKRLLIKLSIISIVVFSIVLFYEVYLSYVPTSYSFKKSLLEARLKSTEVLILGNSKSFFGINPSYLSSNALNLANVSQTLYYDEQITLKYIDQLPKLKRIIIPISYTSLGEQLFDGKENWRDYFYLKYWNIEFPELPRYNIKRFSLLYLFTPITSLKLLLKDKRTSMIENIDTNGYFYVDTLGNSYAISDKLGRERVAGHDADYKELRVASIMRDLESFTKQVTQRGVKIIFITIPTYDTYNKYINRLRFDRDIEYIKQLSQKYNGCSYTNYSNDHRFVKSDFKDNDHLNFIGAKKFTEIINRELLSVDTLKNLRSTMQ